MFSTRRSCRDRGASTGAKRDSLGDFVQFNWDLMNNMVIGDFIMKSDQKSMFISSFAVTFPNEQRFLFVGGFPKKAYFFGRLRIVL